MFLTSWSPLLTCLSSRRLSLTTWSPSWPHLHTSDLSDGNVMSWNDVINFLQPIKVVEVTSKS